MSKRILELVLGACVALLIVVGANTATSSHAAFAPASDDECGKCGDRYCNPRCGETPTSCPIDCGGVSSVVAEECGKCGDGYCNPRCGENATNCPRDCGSTL